MKIFNTIHKDLPASLVVFLVALPLCLGIALASGAPLFSGIIAGIVGGLVVGIISGSSLSVSGPAAGLTTIVSAAIIQFQSFEIFLGAVVICGVFQLLFGILRMGIIGNFFPSTVIKGMLAAIGIILILKQIPHAIGYDKDIEGDEDFNQLDGHNTFSEYSYLLDYITPSAIIISLSSLIILYLWEKKVKNAKLKMLPGALLAVLTGTIVHILIKNISPELTLQPEHLVSLPVTKSLNEFKNYIIMPDWSGFGNPMVWVIGIKLAIIASLETLLSIEAIDKLDPIKRISPMNRELIAQGTGNMISGLIGGLPVTAVIVRSSANLAAGAIGKASAIFHGALLLISVLAFPFILNYIPLSALAAVLLFVGYKLCKIELFKQVYKQGFDSFIPFIVTIISIILSDLLIGIGIGMCVGFVFILKNNFRTAIIFTKDDSNYLVRFIKDTTYFNKSILKNFFLKIKPGSYVIIDCSRPVFIDDDIMEVIAEFQIGAEARGITYELREKPESKN